MRRRILTSQIRPASRNFSRKSAPVWRRLLPLAALGVLGASFTGRAAPVYTWTALDAGPYTWDLSDKAGDYWDNGRTSFPNAAGVQADITSDATSSQLILLNVPITLGVLNTGSFSGFGSFTIDSGNAGAFIFDNSGVNAQINQVMSSAGDTISASVSTRAGLDISNSSLNTLVVSGGVSSAAASGVQTVSVLLGDVRLIGDVVNGGSGGKIALQQSGSGTLTLLGDNSFTGGVTLNSGTLDIGSATALGGKAGVLTINGGTLANNSGGPLTLTNDNAQSWAGDFAFAGPSDLNLGKGAVTLSASRTVTVSAGNLAVGGAIGDGGAGFSLTKAGNGTLILSGASTYGGGTTINGGALNIQNNNALGTGAAVTVNPGAALQLQGDVTISGKALSLNGEGPGQTGTLRSVGGNNVWNGDIAANTAASIVRIVSDAGLLTVNGNIVTNGTAGVFAFQGAGDGVFNGVLSGDAGLTKSTFGAGTWTLNGVNTHLGTTTVSNGAFRLGNANAILSSDVVVNSANGLQFSSGIGTFNLPSLAGGGVSSITLADTNNAPVTLSIGARGTSTTYSGVLSGPGSLVKVGTGSFTLAGPNTFSGGIVVNSGTLVASDSVAVAAGSGTLRSVLGTGTLTVNSGTTIQLRANGAGNATGQILQFASDAATNGNVALNVDRQGGTGSAKTIALNRVVFGAGQVDVTGGNNYGLQVNAAVLAGDVAFNPSTTTTPLTLGTVTETGGARVLTKMGSGKLIIDGSTAHTGGTVIASGGGTLQIGQGAYSGSLSGNVTNDGNLAFSRADGSTYSGIVSGSGSLTKLGSGTLTLTGANTYTGATAVRGGTLVLDYSQTPNVLAATSTPTLAGTLNVKAAATGSTSVTLAAPAVVASSLGRIALDPNGGAGLTLTLGDAWDFGGGSNSFNLDLSRGGTIISNAPVTNGVVTAGVNGVARVTITGADGRTYFPTKDASNQIVPQTSLTALPVSGGSNTVNYQVSGNVTTTGALSVGTLRIDTTTTSGSLDLAGGSLGFGRTAFLMDGSNDFEIKRTSGSGTIANTVIHQYGTGTLYYSAPIAAGGGFTKDGGGLLVGMMTSGAPTSITLLEGVYRVGVATAMPTGTININGGVLELGSGDFTEGLGTSNLQTRIFGDGGFSAFGGTRAVNLGGVLNTITWDQSNFLPNNSTFILSSNKSDSTLDFQNPLALGAITRTVRVNDGSAAVDAQLSGALTGSATLVKTGAGALALSGASTAYLGEVEVREGGVIVSGALGGSVRVKAGVLSGGGDGLSSGVISGGVTMGDGVGSADAILSPGVGVGSLSAAGALSLASDARFRFELDSGLGAADQMHANGISIAAGAVFQGLDLAVSSAQIALNTTFLVLDNTSFSPISGAFSNLANGEILSLGANFFQASYSGGDGNDLTLTTVIPEPSSLGLLVSAASVLGLGRFRRRNR